MSTVKTRGEMQALRWSHPACEECRPCPVFVMRWNSWGEKSAVITSVRIAEKCQLRTIQYVCPPEDEQVMLETCRGP
jgi:hypothetical protein